MNTETSVYAAIKSLFDDRVYPVVVPANTIRPNAAYQIANIQPTASMSCPDGFDFVVVQIDIQADQYSDTVLLADSVASAMAGLGGRIMLSTDMPDTAPAIFRRTLRFELSPIV